MVEMYCQLNHDNDKLLCDECHSLVDYIDDRISNCPFENDKPSCDHCPVHCYRKNEREQIRKIMRFAGPRMTYRHPIMAIVHLIDRRRGKHGDELIAMLREDKD